MGSRLGNPMGVTFRRACRENGSLRGGTLARRQTGRHVPPARLRPRGIPLQRLLPEVQQVPARAHRAVEPQVQFRLARPERLHIGHGLRPDRTLQGSEQLHVLRAHADEAAAQELHVLAAAPVQGEHRQQVDLR